jgi:hypothetical protein
MNRRRTIGGGVDCREHDEPAVKGGLLIHRQFPPGRVIFAQKCEKPIAAANQPNLTDFDGEPGLTPLISGKYANLKLFLF